MLDRGVRHCRCVSRHRRGARRRRGRRPGRRARRGRRSTCGRRSPARRRPTSSSTPRATCARPMVALHRARTAPLHVAGHPLGGRRRARPAADRARRRRAGVPPAPFAWLALGSLARREALPGSDIDSAVAWHGEDADAAILDYALARRAAASTRAWRRAACGSTRRARRPPTRCSCARWPPGAARRRAGSRTPRRSRR